MRLFCGWVLFSFTLLNLVNNFDVNSQEVVAQTTPGESLESFVPSSPTSDNTPGESLESFDGGSINWAGICSKLDFFITEPCENLVTNNDYDLTDKGRRVAACIAGGGLLTLLDPSMQSLLAAQSLGKAAGCSTLLSELSGGGGVGGLLEALGGN
jgi:hypothetical protein